MTKSPIGSTNDILKDNQKTEKKLVYLWYITLVNWVKMYIIKLCVNVVKNKEKRKADYNLRTQWSVILAIAVCSSRL